MDNDNNHDVEDFEKKAEAIQNAYVRKWEIDNEQKIIIVSLIDKESLKNAIKQ
jgi:IS4 transposase